MSFQFQIYPTGSVSNYQPRVNDVSGVSAIVDKETGITEYSMSGIAFYINKVENFFNTTMIGGPASGIISGFFESIGFHKPNTALSDIGPRLNGIISGVNQMYVDYFSAIPSTIFWANQINASSGSFYSTIFNNCFSSESDSYFTNLILQDGKILHIYSGYIENPLVIPSGDADAPIRWGLESGILTLHDLIVQEGNGTQYGIIDGEVRVKDLTNVSGSIGISGNLIVQGAATFYANQLQNAGKVNENIFTFDKHTHDGNSAPINYSALDSTTVVNNNFNLITSGTISATRGIRSNDIGLATTWEVVDTSSLPIGRLNKLFVVGDSLLVSDLYRAVELGSSLKPIGSKNHNGGLGTINHVDGGFGDEGLLLSMKYVSTDINYEDPQLSGSQLDDLIYLNHWPSTATDPSQVNLINFPNGTRYANYSDSILRVGDKTFFSTHESVGGNWYLRSWGIDGSYNLSGVLSIPIVNTYMPLTPFQLEGVLIYPYETAGGLVAVGYNPLFPSGATSNATDFSTSPPAFENRVDMCFDYYNGEGYYLFDKAIYRIAIENRSKPVIISTFLSGCCSIVSYAGRLWTGQALETSYSPRGNTEVDSRLTSSLQDIMGADSDPWLSSPVVFEGWLYAIASKGYADWMSVTFGDKKLVNYFPSVGSRIVRRRASGLDLAESMKYYIR